jgi:DNA-binding IclR family transcriptional regulator
MSAELVIHNNKKIPEDKYIVPAVYQAGRILFVMAESGDPQVSLTTICKNVGISKSKAFCILNTLEAFDFVRKNPNKKGYSLGPSLIKLSSKMLDNLNIPILAEPIIKDLAKKSGATAALALIIDNRTLVMSQFDGATDLGISLPVGHYFPISFGSHGKAIAALLSDQELNNFLRSNKPYFHGAPENFDRARFQKELVQCRRDGFALDLGEIKPGLNTISAVVLGSSNKPIGYIVLGGLFTEEVARSLGPLVAEAARTLSHKAGASIKQEKDVYSE